MWYLYVLLIKLTNYLSYLQIQPELERLGDCHFLGSLHRSKGNLPPPAALTPGSPGQHSVGNPCPPLSVCTHSPSGIFPARHVSTCTVHVCVESSMSVLAQLIPPMLFLLKL